MTASDLVGQAILTVIVVSVALALYRPLLSLSFNAEKAELWSMKPKRAHAALLVLIAVAVIGSFQSVGTLLVFGLLIGPPATASLIARTVPRMMLYSVIIGLFSVWLGLTLSYHLRTADPPPWRWFRSCCSSSCSRSRVWCAGRCPKRSPMPDAVVEKRGHFSW